MRVASEVYKGIEFVRISSLPIEQKEKIWESFDRRNIIKILKDTTLLKDCVQYNDYKRWYEQTYRVVAKETVKEPVLTVEITTANISMA